MKKLIFLTCCIILIGCSVSPRPINFGTDVCEFCKMKIMDPKFGAELVTDKGKVFVFDDINCMVLYKQAPENDRHLYKFEMVMDYKEPRQLIDASKAIYFRSDIIKSPMASRTAAFTEHHHYQSVFHQQKGEVFTWQEIEQVLE